MSNTYVKFMFFSLFMLVFAACSGKKDGSSTSLYAQEGNNMKSGSSTIIKAFGSFELPDDWIEHTRNSRNGKFFYVHKLEANENLPTNISVEMGVNPYPADNPMPFGQAIQRQLIMQTGGKAKISGGGTFTEQGYPLINFTIEDIEPKTPQTTTIQFYIIGDKRHILVHVTDFHNEKVTNAEEVAKMIVNSFRWR